MTVKIISKKIIENTPANKKIRLPGGFFVLYISIIYLLSF